jgi:probable F420-dependent oxidoreductase
MTVAAELEHWLPVIFEDEGQLLDIARAAEEAGFAGVALADHVAIPETFRSVHPSGENPFTLESHFIDPLTTAAAMLAVTTRLKAMSYVYIVTMRNPWLVAKQAGTVATISQGRFSLGVGAGWLVEEIALLGQDPARRGRLLDEQLRLIGDLWDDGWAVAPDGQRVAMFPVPEQRPPIWVGGKSDAALARAARHDGWLGMDYGLDEVWTLLDRLAQHRQRWATEQGQPVGRPFTLVIPHAEATPDLHARLAERGVTATIALPWNPGDPGYASLAAKRAAMAAWSETFQLV